MSAQAQRSGAARRRGTCGTRASCCVSELASSRAALAGPIGPGRAAWGRQFQRARKTRGLTQVTTVQAAGTRQTVEGLCVRAWRRGNEPKPEERTKRPHQGVVSQSVSHVQRVKSNCLTCNICRFFGVRASANAVRCLPSRPVRHAGGLAGAVPPRNK